MPQCGFLGLAQNVASTGRSGCQPKEPWPRMYVATRAGMLALYSLAPEVSSQEGEWQATLVREVRTCRPFRHFTERKLNLGAQRAGEVHLGASASASASASAASPKPSPRGEPPQEPSKWLSAVEMATHVPLEVPLWLCPQLKFFAYPADMPNDEICAALREGRAVEGRRRIHISRPSRDGVRYDMDSSSPGAEDRLSRLFGGALGATMEEPHQAEGARGGSRATAAPKGQAVLSVGSAWGAISEQHLGSVVGDLSLEQPDGTGSGLEEVDEDWLKA